MSADFTEEAVKSAFLCISVANYFVAFLFCFIFAPINFTNNHTNKTFFMKAQTTYLASKPHYEILDGLRGVAALMVIIFHLFEAHAGGNHLVQIINHGYLAVDFFFMLSGFVIGYAYDDRWDRMTLGTFFKRRVIRLHPMVIMGSIVGAVFFYFQKSEVCFPQIADTPVWMLLLLMSQ